MSVQGEFRRALTDCRAVLQGSRTPAAERWVRELDAAEREGRQNLSRGAERALALCETTARSAAFGSDPQLRELARLQEHLAAICRVILGRPGPTP